jgi:hypothetical protein
LGSSINQTYSGTNSIIFISIPFPFYWKFLEKSTQKKSRQKVPEKAAKNSINQKNFVLNTKIPCNNPHIPLVLKFIPKKNQIKPNKKIGNIFSSFFFTYQKRSFYSIFMDLFIFRLCFQLYHIEHASLYWSFFRLDWWNIHQKMHLEIQWFFEMFDCKNSPIETNRRKSVFIFRSSRFVQQKLGIKIEIESELIPISWNFLKEFRSRHKKCQPITN